MKYRNNHRWPKKARRLGISKEIARTAIKRIPSDTPGRDLTYRLGSTTNYFYHAIFHKDDVWLELGYSWASHAYLLDGMAGQRLRELADLVDSWSNQKNS